MCQGPHNVLSYVTMNCFAKDTGGVINCLGVLKISFLAFNYVNLYRGLPFASPVLRTILFLAFCGGNGIL